MDIKKITKYFIAKEYIGGISFTDSSLHFLLFSPKDQKKIIASFEADLPQGVIVEGELKKPEFLKPILEGLHRSSELKKIKHLYVVVSLESGTVFHKIFDLPQMGSKELMGAVQLNMKMLSPIKFDEVYSDWEAMGEQYVGQELKFRIMSIFGKKTIVDPFVNVLTETGFIPLAVEFQALSLWRLFNSFNLLADQKSHLVILLSAEGLDFAVIKDTGLQFNYFQTWQGALQASPVVAPEASRGVLSKEAFTKIFTDELRRVFAFYLNRFQEGIASVFLFSPVNQEDLVKIVEGDFHLMVQRETPQFGYSPGFFAVAGSAIRGLIPRVDDMGVSLMSVGTQEEYRRRRSLSFINLWSKVAVVIFIILAASSFGVNFFLGTMSKSLLGDLSNLNMRVDEQKLKNLQDEATIFNKAVDQAVAVENSVHDWSGFFQFWQDNGPEIKTKEFIISSLETPVTFNGWVNTQSKMIDFKNKMLDTVEYFSGVDIPLQSIIQDKNGVEFNLNFTINKLPK